MKISTFFSIFALAAAGLTPIAHAQGAAPAAAEHPYISLEAEIKHAIGKGVDFLTETQHEDGYWGNPQIPAYTALAAYNMLRNPNRDDADTLPVELEKALDWIVSQQKDDGGIYGKGLATYNTSLSIMALLAGGREIDEPVIVEARRFLVNQQADIDIKGVADSKFDGGIGYGGSYAHSDLSNMHFAVQAIRESQHLIENEERFGKQPDLDWEAAATFISRCQNLPETNDQEFASGDPDNKGGFVYFPGNTKAGEQDLGDGKVALRSYGSISYAGLLSLVYADLDEDDVRVKAVVKWLADNYTITENPGMGAEGRFYYYQAMSKALTAANIDKLVAADGTVIDWRRDLSRQLVTEQNPDGSWLNDNSRWFEGDAPLVTAYGLTALINVQNSIIQIEPAS